MPSLIEHPRLAPMLLVAACIGALGTAFVAEYWGGLAPCVLCIYQRYVYGAALALGIVGALAGTPQLVRLLMILAGVTFLIGAGVAFFNVGVEHLWWRGTDGCHAPPMDASQSAEELLSSVLNSDFTPCDQIAWSLFGITIAGYNTLASLALAFASFWAARQIAREIQA